MAYADGTTVPVEKTKAEIDTLLRKRGSRKFGSMEANGHAVVMFELHGKAIRFTMPAEGASCGAQAAQPH